MTTTINVKHCGDPDNGKACCRDVELEPGIKNVRDWRMRCKRDNKCVGSMCINNDWRIHCCHHSENQL